MGGGRWGDGDDDDHDDDDDDDDDADADGDDDEDDDGGDDDEDAPDNVDSNDVGTVAVMAAVPNPAKSCLCCRVSGHGGMENYRCSYDSTAKSISWVAKFGSRLLD